MTNPPTEQRSRTMRAVKGRDTAPEMLVRRLAFGMGYRYRLYRKDLPGKPDLAFPGRHKVVFIHGCFWHGHDCTRGARPPKQNAEYWSNKIARNKARDVAHLATLHTLGWKCLVIWECELKDMERVRRLLSSFLEQRQL